MRSLEGLKQQLLTTRDLGTVVSTMKTLSAVNIRQYEAAVRSLSEYARTVGHGLQVVLRDHLEDLFQESTPDQTSVVIFGSDTGLCGRFNETIVRFALDDLNSLDPGQFSIIAVGARVALELNVRGFEAEKTLNLPGSLQSLTTCAQDILSKLEHWGQEGDRRVLLYYNRTAGRAGFKARQLQIYPLDFSWLKPLAESCWESRSLPIYTMDWQLLFSALIREYYFVTLYRSLAESLASENAARLAAMQAAEQSIEEQLSNLMLELNLIRQASITEELQDIMTGAEVLSGG